MPVVERFVCLDVDRTILKSTTFVEEYVYPALVDLYGDEARGMLEAVQQEERANRGRAFDYLAVCGEYMAQLGHRAVAYEQVAQEILARASADYGRIPTLFIDDILVDGSLELVRLLDQAGRWGFLTTGGQQTQSLKLFILDQILVQELGIHSQGMVVSTEQKADMMDKVWRDPESGLFTLPDELTGGTQLTARSLMMIDDKPKNLRHEGDNIETVLVVAAESNNQDDEGYGRRQTLNEVRKQFSI